MGTLTEQLSKKNEEFQKLQENAAKQIQELNTGFAGQQKQRQEEMETYKKEIAALYEKNIRSEINEKTAALQAGLEAAKLENAQLDKKLQEQKTDYTKIIMAAIIALVIGYITAKTI